MNPLKDRDIQWWGEYDNIDSDSQQEVSLHISSTLLSIWHSGRIFWFRLFGQNLSKALNRHHSGLSLISLGYLLAFSLVGKTKPKILCLVTQEEKKAKTTDDKSFIMQLPAVILEFF